MKKFKLVSALLLSSICFTTFASIDTRPIILGSGDVKPKGELQICIDKLGSRMFSGIKYNINCDIENKFYTKKDPVLILFYISGNPPNVDYYVNEKKLTQRQAIMRRLINKYMISKIEIPWNPESRCMYHMQFENADDSDSVTVKNCIATPYEN